MGKEKQNNLFSDNFIFLMKVVLKFCSNSLLTNALKTSFNHTNIIQLQVPNHWKRVKELGLILYTTSLKKKPSLFLY